MAENEPLVSNQPLHFIAANLRKPGPLQHIALRWRSRERIPRWQRLVRDDPAPEVEMAPEISMVEPIEAREHEDQPERRDRDKAGKAQIRPIRRCKAIACDAGGKVF